MNYDCQILNRDESIPKIDNKRTFFRIKVLLISVKGNLISVRFELFRAWNQEYVRT